MQQNFNAVNGQSLLDVCLNTYGTSDLLLKLMQDNGVSNLDYTPATGQVFVYDDSLVINQGLNVFFLQAGVKYATDINR